MLLGMFFALIWMGFKAVDIMVAVLERFRGNPIADHKAYDAAEPELSKCAAKQNLPEHMGLRFL